MKIFVCMFRQLIVRKITFTMFLYTFERTYRAWLRQEVVDAWDAPHALQVLLRLDGDRAECSCKWATSHGHLDTGLGAGCPAQAPPLLPHGKDAVGWVGDPGSGWSGGECDHTVCGQSGGLSREGADRQCWHFCIRKWFLESLQSLLPQMLHRSGTHLAPSACMPTLLWPVRYLQLLEEEGGKTRVLQEEENKVKKML